MMLGPNEEAEHERLAQQRAEQGLEVLADTLKYVPHKTERCTGIEYRHYRSLAQSGRHLSIFCLPMLSPVGTVATIW